MNSSDDDQSFEFERLCEALDKLAIGRDFGIESVEEQIFCDPTEKTFQNLLNLLSSSETYNLKSKAVIIFNRLVSDWISGNGAKSELVNKSISTITSLLISEENPLHQEKLLLLCLHLIKAMNKNKVEKWELPAKLVRDCITVTVDRPNLTKMITKTLVTTPRIFGKNAKRQLFQYSKFLKSFLTDFYGQPKFTFLCMDMLDSLLLRNKKHRYLSNELFSHLVLLLIDAMDAFVSTSNGIDFMEKLKRLLITDDEIFEINLNLIIQGTIKILMDIHVGDPAWFELCYWLELIINTFFTDVKDSFDDYILIIVDNTPLIQTQPLGKNDLNEWLTNYLKSKAFYFKQYERPTHSHIEQISSITAAEKIYTVLLTDVVEYLKTFDGSDITNLIDIFGTKLKLNEKTIYDEPREVFNLAAPYFSNNDPKIFSSAIDVILNLCNNYDDPQFNDLHLDIFSLIITSAQNHSSIEGKLKAILSLEQFSVKGCITDYRMFSKGMVQLFLDALSALSSINDKSLWRSVIELVHENMFYLYNMLNEKIEPYLQDIVQSLLKALDIAFTMNKSRLFRCVLDCLEGTFEPCYIMNRSFCVRIILKYVEEFNKKHSLSSDYLEILPCFFPILYRLLFFDKSESYAPALPKIGRSIIKYLSQIKILSLVSLKDPGDFLSGKLSPFKNDKSFLNQNNDGVGLLCRFVTLLVEKHDMKFSSYSESILTIIIEIIKVVRETCGVIVIIGGVSAIFKSLIVHGDNEKAKNIWNNSLKKTFFKLLNKYTDHSLYHIISHFKMCITACNLGEALNTADIKLIADIFNTHMIDIVKRTEATFQLKKNPEYYFVEPPFGGEQYFFESSLDGMECFVQEALPIYKERIVDAVFPMFRTLITYPRSIKSENFIIFLLRVTDSILEVFHSSNVEFSKLLPAVLNFCLTVLSVCSYENVLEIAVDTAKGLKNSYPIHFDEHLNTLDSDSRIRVQQRLKEQ